MFNHQHHLVDSDEGHGYGQDELQRDPESCKAALVRCRGVYQRGTGRGITKEERSRLQVHPSQQPKQAPRGKHGNSTVKY